MSESTVGRLSYISKIWFRFLSWLLLYKALAVPSEIRQVLWGDVGYVALAVEVEGTELVIGKAWRGDKAAFVGKGDEMAVEEGVDVGAK